VRRESDDWAGAEHRSRVRGAEILLTDVDAVSAGQPRDIHTIVDDENAAGGMRDVADADGQIEKRASRNGLGANLQPPRAAGNAGGRQIRERPARAGGDIGVEDDVEPWKGRGSRLAGPRLVPRPCEPRRRGARGSA